MVRDSYPASLLSHWQVSEQRSPQEIEWDLMLRPLLFGPISILDNMLVDNPGLMEAVTKREFANLLELYARKGLIRLLHRETYGPDRPIRSIDDLLMIWLSRSDPKAVKTVGLVSLENAHDWQENSSGTSSINRLLDGYRNQQLRQLITGFGGKATKDERVAEFREFMSAHGPPRFLEALHVYQRSFFGRSPLSRERWNRFPETIQSRILSTFGVVDANRMIAEANGNARELAQSLLEFKGFHAPPLFAGLDWKRVVRSAVENDDRSRHFFGLLAQTGDAGWGNLYASAVDIRDSDPVMAKWVSKLVTQAYVCGIPEANAGRIMLDHLEDPYLPNIEEFTDSYERDRILERISIKKDELIEGAFDIGLLLHRADRKEAREILKRRLTFLSQTLDLEMRESRKVPASLRNLAGIAGRGAFSVAALHFADIQNLTDSVDPMLGILGYSAFELSGWAAEKAIEVVYPRVPQLNGVIGIHDGSVYKRGACMIDTIRIVETSRAGDTS